MHGAPDAAPTYRSAAPTARSGGAKSIYADEDFARVMEHALDEQQQFNASRANKRGQDDLPLDELAGSVTDKVRRMREERQQKATLLAEFGKPAEQGVAPPAGAPTMPPEPTAAVPAGQGQR